MLYCVMEINTTTNTITNKKTKAMIDNFKLMEINAIWFDERVSIRRKGEKIESVRLLIDDFIKVDQKYYYVHKLMGTINSEVLMAFVEYNNTIYTFNAKSMKLERLQIDWIIDDEIDVLSWNWGLFQCVGGDRYGNIWIGNTQTYISDPQIFEIEGITLDS